MSIHGNAIYGYYDYFWTRQPNDDGGIYSLDYVPDHQGVAKTKIF